MRIFELEIGGYWYTFYVYSHEIPNDSTRYDDWDLCVAHEHAMEYFNNENIIVSDWRETEYDIENEM